MKLAGVSSSNTPTSRPIHSSRTHWSRRDRCAVNARVRRVSRLGRNAVPITIKNTHAWTIVAADSEFSRGVGVPPEATAYLQSVLSCPRQREALRTDPHFLQQFRTQLLARLWVNRER